MLMLFFDISGSILVEWMPKGTMINAACYVDEVAHKHQKSLERKIKWWNRDVAWQHKSHMMWLTMSILTTLKLEFLVHSVYISCRLYTLTACIWLDSRARVTQNEAVRMWLCTLCLWALNPPRNADWKKSKIRGNSQAIHEILWLGHCGSLKKGGCGIPDAFWHTKPNQ